MAQRALNPTEFANLVNAITSAFGDPTRRDIYLLIHEHPDGLTASEVAEATGLHANVARHHLDKLAAGGYLEVAVERAEGAGAGRPSKHYRVSADAKVDLTGDVPVHRDDLVLSLLGRALALLPHDKAEAMAEEVGQEYGLAMAQGLTGADLAVGQRSLRSAMQAVADALTAHGFAAHADQRPACEVVTTSHISTGSKFIAASHGSFDNNKEVIERTINRILGNAPDAALAVPVEDLGG